MAPRMAVMVRGSSRQVCVKQNKNIQSKVGPALRWERAWLALDEARSMLGTLLRWFLAGVTTSDCLFNLGPIYIYIIFNFGLERRFIEYLGDIIGYSFRMQNCLNEYRCKSNMNFEYPFTSLIYHNIFTLSTSSGWIVCK